MGKTMLTDDRQNSLLIDQHGELDTPLDSRMVPLQPGPPDDPIQIAGNANLSRAGQWFSDLFRPGKQMVRKLQWDDTMMHAWERFVDKMAAQRRAELAAEKAGVSMEFEGHKRQGEPAKPAPAVIEQPAAAVAEPPPVIEDPHQALYQVDDAEVDRLLGIDTLRVVDPNQGLLRGGIRAEGTVDGIVDPANVKIPDENGVRQLIEAGANRTTESLRKINPKNVEQFSLDETERLANLIGLNREKLRKRLAAGFQIDINNPGALGAHVHAAKQMLVDELQILNKLIDHARAAGSDKARLAVLQQSELVNQLQAQFTNAKTEMGRALNALKIEASADKALMQIDVRRLLDENGGADRVNEFMDNFVRTRNQPNAAQKQLKYNRDRTFFQKGVSSAYEVYVNAILSGPWTHVKNTVGVAATMLVDNAVALGTAMRQVPYPLVGKKPDVTLGDVGAKVFGQLMSMDEAIRVGMRQFKTREDQLGGYRVEMGRGAPGGHRHVDAWSAEGWGARQGSAWATIADWSGNVMTLWRGSTRMLMLEDGFWKTMSYRSSLYEQGYSSGRQQGLSGEELSEHIADTVHNPTPEVHNTAVEQAKYVALQSEQVGTSKQIQKALQGRLLRWIVPFYNTPANAILWVNDHGPLARFWSSRYRSAQHQGGAAAAKANTQWYLGMGVATSLYLLYSDERITGGISANRSIRNLYARQGIKPYSFRPGNTWYPYNVVEPVATLVGLVTDGMEIATHPDTDDATAFEVATTIAGAIGYNLTNKTFMASLSNFIDTVKDPDSSLDRFFMGYASSMFPASSMLNEFRKWLDNHMSYIPKSKRDTKWYKAVEEQIVKQMREHPDGSEVLAQWQRHSKDLNMLRQVLQQWKRKIPGLSKDIQPRRDLWGRYISEHRFSPHNPNAVDSELIDIAKATGWAPNPNPDHFTENIGFTPEERDEYHKYIGPLQFKALQDYFKNNPDYKQLKKAMLGGDTLAGEAIKLAISKLILDIRDNGKIWMAQHPKWGGFLTEATQKIEAAKQQAAQETIEAVR